MAAVRDGPTGISGSPLLSPLPPLLGSPLSPDTRSAYARECGVTNGLTARHAASARMSAIRFLMNRAMQPLPSSPVISKANGTTHQLQPTPKARAFGRRRGETQRARCRETNRLLKARTAGAGVKDFFGWEGDA